MRIDDLFPAFIGTLSWADQFNILSRADDEGSLVEVYGRPVYASNIDMQKQSPIDVIFFNGRRWVITKLGTLLEEEQLNDTTAVAKYFQDTFHG